MLSTIVPVDVVNACLDLAVRAAAEDLLPDLDTGLNVIKTDKAGPLETEYFQNRR